jgi:outer membrane protein
MKKFALVTSTILLFFTSIRAQNILTAEEAVNLALKNNYDILISRNQADIDRINNTAGNAGMLPNVAINGSYNYSQSDLDQKLSSGTGPSNLSSNSYNAAATLDWTLFDGGKMFITKSKLKEIQSLGEIQFKSDVLQTTYNVIVSYYNIVRQKQQLASIDEVIAYNKELVKILEVSFNAGLSSKTNLLQAQIDLNVFQEDAITQQSVIIAAKRTLNQLLGRDADLAFEVLDSIPLNYQPNKTEIISKLDSTNTSILALQRQVNISALSLKEYQTLRLPRISLEANYGYSNVENSTGNLLRNRSFGPSVGAFITIPIFSAGNTNRQISVAKINYQNTNFSLDSTRLLINTKLRNALTDFEYQQQLLDIELKNSTLARENFEISIQRLKLGQTTTLEVRQAQSSFVESFTRLINFKYNLKLAETRLRQLISNL